MYPESQADTFVSQPPPPIYTDLYKRGEGGTDLWIIMIDKSVESR